MNLKDKKCLIAYYSRRGSNCVGGRIVDLPIGNTEAAAKMILEITEGDMFHIEAVKPYSKDYSETAKAAQNELHGDARPELTNQVENWWGTMPMPVFTFLGQYDFSGKTIVPFCTHEGSGLGHSEKDIMKLCPKASVLKGLAIYGSAVDSAKASISIWLDKINVRR